MNNFEDKVKASLNADLENLDADTRQQLVAARRKALNQSTKKSWYKNWQQFWLPAGSLALCSLLAVFIYVNPKPDNSHTNIANNQAAVETTDQLAALELLTEADASNGNSDETGDPDFYLWADEMLATESAAHAV